MSVNMKTSFCGIEFKNPIVIASTDIGRSAQTFERFARAGVGGIITKSVTDSAPLQNKAITMFDLRDLDGEPLSGKRPIPSQYSFFSRGGAMIAMDAYEEEAREILKVAETYDVVPIASLCCSKIENWVDCAKRFEAMGYPMLELNLGNPHGDAAKDKLGFRISQEEALCIEVASAVVNAVSIPVTVKLTPQVADLAALTAHLEEAGIKAVTIMHRFQALVIDPDTLDPVIGGYAAIGGPWMKPLALANVAKVRNATGLEIMGGNGADTAQDVIDFICAGAGLVQIGSTMMLRGPKYAEELLAELEKRLERYDKSADALCGVTARKITEYKELGRIAPRHASVDTGKCLSCAEKPCLDRCCYGALEQRDGAVIYNEDSCSGCGMCAYVCPEDAVRIIKEEKN